MLMRGGHARFTERYAASNGVVTALPVAS